MPQLRLATVSKTAESSTASRACRVWGMIIRSPGDPFHLSSPATRVSTYVDGDPQASLQRIGYAELREPVAVTDPLRDGAQTPRRG